MGGVLGSNKGSFDMSTQNGKALVALTELDMISLGVLKLRSGLLGVDLTAGVASALDDLRSSLANLRHELEEVGELG